jgi:hypothetical protein
MAASLDHDDPGNKESYADVFDMNRERSVSAGNID